MWRARLSLVLFRVFPHGHKGASLYCWSEGGCAWVHSGVSMTTTRCGIEATDLEPLTPVSEAFGVQSFCLTHCEAFNVQSDGVSLAFLCVAMETDLQRKSCPPVSTKLGFSDCCSVVRGLSLFRCYFRCLVLNKRCFSPCLRNWGKQTARVTLSRGPRHVGVFGSALSARRVLRSERTGRRIAHAHH